MRSVVLLGLLLLAGCQSFSPIGAHRSDRADDPFLTTQEQRRKARSYYAYPDEELGPRSGTADRSLLRPEY
jgi:hypothetical protein